MRKFTSLFCVSVYIWLPQAKAADAASPMELMKLQASYEAEIARITEPVKRRYLDALQKLQEYYTKAGDLDKALIVRDEMQKAGAVAATDKKIVIATKDLEGSEWQWGSGGTLKLEKGGKATHTAWATPGNWKRINNVTITVQRPGGDPPMTAIFSDPELTNAVITSHLGTSTTITRIVK